MNDYDPNYVPSKVSTLVGQKAVVLNKQNSILVLQRSAKSGLGGKWSLPGGAIEYAEDPYAAISREIAEETNLAVVGLQPFSLRTYTKTDGDFVLIVGYTCRATEEIPQLNWEHDQYRWLTPEDALQLDLTEDGRFFIEVFINAKSQ